MSDSKEIPPIPMVTATKEGNAATETGSGDTQDADLMTFLTMMGLNSKETTTLVNKGIIMPGDFAELDTNWLDDIQLQRMIKARFRSYFLWQDANTDPMDTDDTQ